MDSKKIAVIDLGSNTFHIQIVEIGVEKRFSIIHKERSFVGLAENGIELLSEAAMSRGIDALRHFAQLLEDHGVVDYRVFGTSALRSAANSDKFIEKVEETSGLTIEVIDGDREADLIYKGVTLIADVTQGRHIIMDVGGGSVEFIVIEDGRKAWSQSFDVGVGVLYNIMPTSDPISTEEIEIIENYVQRKIGTLKNYLSGMTVDSLIGASGSFEVVQSMNGKPLLAAGLTEISIDAYHQVADRIITSTLSERQNMEGLPESRIKLIVVAMILINIAVDIIRPSKISISPYALKEGVISELLQA